MRPFRPDSRTIWTLWIHRTDMTPALQGLSAWSTLIKSRRASPTGDERHNKGSQANPADSLKESQLAARSVSAAAEGLDGLGQRRGEARRTCSARAA
jgi:hypothetical protein